MGGRISELTTALSREDIVRVQDAEGRGPFKPGFTKRWISLGSTSKRDTLPPWMQEMPEACDVELHPDEKLACAVRATRLLRWFKHDELRRLERLGYQVVLVRLHADCHIVAESDNQLVVVRRGGFEGLTPLPVCESCTYGIKTWRGHPRACDVCRGLGFVRPAEIEAAA